MASEATDSHQTPCLQVCNKNDDQKSLRKGSKFHSCIMIAYQWRKYGNVSQKIVPEPLINKVKIRYNKIVYKSKTDDRVGLKLKARSR